MARRRAKPGLVQTAASLSALSYVSGYGANNAITQAFVGALPPVSKFPGGKIGKGATMAIIGQLLHTEGNKLGVNPMILNRVRLL